MNLLFRGTVGGKNRFPDSSHDPIFDADSILKGLLITSSLASISKIFLIFEKQKRHDSYLTHASRQ